MFKSLFSKKPKSTVEAHREEEFSREFAIHSARDYAAKIQESINTLNQLCCLLEAPSETYKRQSMIKLETSPQNIFGEMCVLTILYENGTGEPICANLRKVAP